MASFNIEEEITNIKKRLNDKKLNKEKKFAHIFFHLQCEATSRFKINRTLTFKFLARRRNKKYFRNSSHRHNLFFSLYSVQERGGRGAPFVSYRRIAIFTLIYLDVSCLAEKQKLNKFYFIRD